MYIEKRTNVFRNAFIIKAMSVIVFLAIPFLHANASGVSIVENNITIKQAFDKIESQTGYTFAYNQSKFNDAKKITLSLENATIQTALNQILSATDYTYKINGSHIILTFKEKPKPAKNNVVYTPPRKEAAPKPPEVEEELVVLPHEIAPIPIKENKKLLNFTSRKPLQPAKKYSPVAALKTNLLYDATTTFNLGLEFKLNNCLTLELPVNYNPWTFSDNKKIKHILVQPELRYWFCESFNGHFLGFHAHYARFNAGNIDMPNAFPALAEHRFDGSLYGVGASYGYQWYLAPRWAMEATFGFGYFYAEYDKYLCPKCGDPMGKGYKHYFGPTKVGLSIIFIIK